MANNLYPRWVTGNVVGGRISGGGNACYGVRPAAWAYHPPGTRAFAVPGEDT
jgi:hypothetical protein